MKRDPALIRALLAYSEKHQNGNQPLAFPMNQPVEDWLEDYVLPDWEIPSVPFFISGHMQMMIDAKLAEGTVHVDRTSWKDYIVHGTISDPWFDKLTPEGYDLLSALSNESVWEMVKEKMAKTGGSFTFQILKTVATKALTDLLT